MTDQQAARNSIDTLLQQYRPTDAVLIGRKAADIIERFLYPYSDITVLYRDGDADRYIRYRHIAASVPAIAKIGDSIASFIRGIHQVPSLGRYRRGWFSG